MKESKNVTLILELHKHMAHLRATLENQNKTKRRDYPAMSDACECACGVLWGIGNSHNSHNSHKKDELKGLHPEIVCELKKRLGPIGKNSSNGCKNGIGCCAENFAASEVLKKMNCSHYVLSNLSFTKAFRPRTGEMFDWCLNCKTMFS